MKAKHSFILLSFLLSLFFFFHGCGGDDGQAPKGSYPYRPPGSVTPGAGKPVVYHSNLDLFLKFKERVKNSEFDNKVGGDYSYRILGANSCKTFLKIFQACYNAYSGWGGSSMRTHSVSANLVVGHPWGTLPAVNMKLNELLDRVLERMTQAGAGVNLSSFFVGVGENEFDIRDNDNTVYRISRLRPLGANPIMQVKTDGSGYILTYWPVPLTW